MEKNKLLIGVILSFVFCFSLVSAVPQAIFTSVNINVTGSNNSGSYRIWGEGLETTETFTIVNGSFSYARMNIPITITREVTGCNDTDLGKLLAASANMINFSSKWEACINLNRDLANNLTICQMDVGYKSNYTECNNDRITLQSSLSEKVSQLQTCNNRNKELENQRLICIVIAALGVGFAIFAYNRNTPKKVISPYAQLPSAQRI